MAASSYSYSSSSRPLTWRYRVFTSFHGPDVRKTFLSHLRKQFSCNGISMFDDQGIERSQTIAPALTQAIRESRISIVVLTKNYASSGWCLDELMEIFKCKEDIGQIVMTVFYGVDPSDVRKQTGEFGRAFSETCRRKTEEERRRWSQALSDVGNIAGEHFLNWDNESKMIEKIAIDVSNKLNTTVSRDFEGMVGIEAHLGKMQSLLHLHDEDEAMIVGICGPAGIGKTTIARALHSRLSSSFQLTCFMENLRGSYHNGLDEYGLKLCLQEQLLSKILNKNGMRIYHLGAIPERLCDQKVLIILDDVDDLQQLEALANETSWFGPGSRIIITTEDQELLEQHGIDNTYYVDFPTEEEASKIFCSYAFKRSYAPDGFEKLVKRVTMLCSNLPLGLRVMGSTLRGKKEVNWEGVLHRLENSLDRKIDAVLRVGYDSLHENDQSLFLHIAFFFNYENDDHVMAMLADSSLDVRLGLNTLAYKSLIQISTNGEVVMHKLLRQMGRQTIQRQEPWKRQILINAHDLETDNGSKSVTGVSLDISTIPNMVNISKNAFKNMSNLRFLRITTHDTNDRLHVHEDMDFPTGLRLLHWEVYPGKCLPRTFMPQNLVELDLRENKLEKLWEDTQRLTNLKKMVLAYSPYLKELPDLSNATNLEKLDLIGCRSLVELPSCIGNLQKLEWLQMAFCIKLQVVPSLFNLASLERVDMVGCWQLRKIPDIFGNIIDLTITDTMLEEMPESISHWSRLGTLHIWGSVNPYIFSKYNFPERSGADVDRIPDWIKDFPALDKLHIVGCPKLASLPELPRSLRKLTVDNCESLETITSFPIDSRIESLCFTNCFKLGPEARRVITQQPSLELAWLPGWEIPAEFHHRALGNSLTISSSFYPFRVKVCLVVTTELHTKRLLEEFFEVLCRISLYGCPVAEEEVMGFPNLRGKHLCIFQLESLMDYGGLEQDDEVLFQFSTSPYQLEIVECGVQILTDDDDDEFLSDDDECLSAVHNCESLETIISFPDSQIEGLSFTNCYKLGPEARRVNTRQTRLAITDTMLEEFLLQTISLGSRLQRLFIKGSINTYPLSEENLPERSGADIERIPDCIKDLPGLDQLAIFGCPKLASLPELPRSLTALLVENCESLETITSFPIDSQIEGLGFINCYKLGPEARRVITQQPSLEEAWLPGWEIPAEFRHRALGNSLTISSSSYRFRVCGVVTPKLHTKAGHFGELFDVLCRISLNGFPVGEQEVTDLPYIRGKHLCIFQLESPKDYTGLEQDSEVLFQFSSSSHDVEIVECGVQILTDDGDDERLSDMPWRVYTRKRKRNDVEMKT